MSLQLTVLRATNGQKDLPFNPFSRRVLSIYFWVRRGGPKSFPTGMFEMLRLHTSPPGSTSHLLAWVILFQDYFRKMAGYWDLFLYDPFEYFISMLCATCVTQSGLLHFFSLLYVIQPTRWKTWMDHPTMCFQFHFVCYLS